MLVNNILTSYYLGNGGIGDFFMFLSTFYDNIEEANIVFFANNRKQIQEVASLFPKLKKKLILENDFNTLKEFYSDPRCIGTGILPKDLDYNKWDKVDIVKEYGVNLRPKFIHELFTPHKIYDNQVFLQISGSNVEQQGKQRLLLESTLISIYDEFDQSAIITLDSLSAVSYKDIFDIILGSDTIVGVDSFVKTFSALGGIRTIVYDNIYSDQYLNNFKDKRDYGHYIFIDPFTNIELRKQTIK